MPKMTQKRYRAATVLNEDGDMWVLGGTYDSTASEATEVFRYQARTNSGSWTRGRPLPDDLRDSGIESHCVVQLNKTHIFMAGGYARAYRFSDPLAPKPSGDPDPEIEVNPRFRPRTSRQIKDDNSDIGGGYSLRRAWLYDGYYWREIQNMYHIRDRPACSTLNMPDGTIRVLVAGGCEGWCVKNPAMTSAEMYNPDTDDWTKVADLPVPLSSASMQLLDGVATLVGGYNTETKSQNKVLYQYHVETGTWKAHPDISLRIARSSPAVFQVPKYLFNC